MNRQTVHLQTGDVRNKTIIGLKLEILLMQILFLMVRNKTIIGLK